MKGYVDITIDDLKKIQEIAHRHARGKPRTNFCASQDELEGVFLEDEGWK